MAELPLVELQKENAAKKAVELVENNMVIGLGTGSTAAYFVKFLAEKVRKEKLKIRCVCTSLKTHKMAEQLGLEIVKLKEVDKINLAIDGADVIDQNKYLIKGYGGALVREKVIEYFADNFVVIADESKLQKKLNKSIPVEFLPFAHALVTKRLKQLGAKEVKDRMVDGMPFVSDNGFWIVDAYFGEIEDPVHLEEQITKIPGTLENGIFTKRINKVIIGTKDGAREI
ncbi:MAG: ribose-5-phosphate isomerase RpiA [Candidatus Micrarchaeota archaeon]